MSGVKVSVRQLLRQGIAAHEAGRYKAAEAAYRKVLSARPDNPDALNLMGVLARQLKRPGRAALLLARAVELRPDIAEYHSNLGCALRDQGNVDAAIEAQLKAIELKPDFGEAYNNLGNAYRQAGRFDDAIASYRQALRLQPGYVEAYRHMSWIKTYTVGDPDIAEMERLAAADMLSDDDAIQLRFALAKAHEDIADHDAAFAHMARANRLQRAKMPFDIAETERLFDGIVETFSADFIAANQSTGCDSEVPVFVLGMPRSGSTLVEQILASHPRVFGAGELLDMGRVLAALRRASPESRIYPRAARDVGRDTFRALGEEFAAGLSRRAPKALRVTDKLPYSFQFIGLIHLMLPHARIVHCRRNPIDVCVSCYKTMFSQGHEFSYDLTSLGLYYRQFDRLMRHWREVLPGRVLDVDYEDVVGDLEGAARRLVAHCGLEWDDACLDFHANRRPVRTASSVQVRQPLYDTSVERWRRYERHLGPLLEALGDLAPVTTP